MIFLFLKTTKYNGSFFLTQISSNNDEKSLLQKEEENYAIILMFCLLK